jgi:hypothetical protein
MGPRKFALYLAVIVGVLISTPLPAGPVFGTPPFSLPAQVRRSLPTDDPVTITFPYASFVTTETMLWQSSEDFRFRLLGGYAYHPNSEGGPTWDPTGLQPGGLQQFLVRQNIFTAYLLDPLFDQPLPSGHALITETRQTLKHYDIQVVVVERGIGSTPVVTLFRRVLGPPSVVTHSFSVWIGAHHAL